MPHDYWFPTAFSAWDDQERAAMARVVASGRFTAGDEVRAFEGEFAALHDMLYGVMVNSGSSANLLAVAALFHVKQSPLKRGDRAIVPAMAWATTYAPLVQYGLDLVLVDCDDTWNMRPNLTSEVKEHSPRLIIGCSILGNPGHLSDWRMNAAGGNTYFIEDNCESIGAATDGRFCGTFGDMNTFSFFYSHQLSAIEGGMILTNHAECADLCRMLRDHGMTRSVGKISRFEDEYDFRLMGYNLRPLEMHAAIAREQLKKLPTLIKARTENLSYFIERCKELEIPVTFQKHIGSQSPFGIAFACENTEERSNLVTALRSNGVDCRLTCGGSFRKHEYGKQWSNQKTPVADRIHDTALFIGCPPYESKEQIDRIILVIKGALCRAH